MALGPELRCSSRPLIAATKLSGRLGAAPRSRRSPSGSTSTTPHQQSSTRSSASRQSSSRTSGSGRPRAIISSNRLSPATRASARLRSSTPLEGTASTTRLRSSLSMAVLPAAAPDAIHRRAPTSITAVSVPERHPRPLRRPRSAPGRTPPTAPGNHQAIVAAYFFNRSSSDPRLRPRRRAASHWLPETAAMARPIKVRSMVSMHARKSTVPSRDCIPVHVPGRWGLADKPGLVDFARRHPAKRSPSARSRSAARGRCPATSTCATSPAPARPARGRAGPACSSAPRGSARRGWQCPAFSLSTAEHRWGTRSVDRRDRRENFQQRWRRRDRSGSPRSRVRRPGSAGIRRPVRIRVPAALAEARSGSRQGGRRSRRGRSSRLRRARNGRGADAALR